MLSTITKQKTSKRTIGFSLDKQCTPSLVLFHTIIILTTRKEN